MKSRILKLSVLIVLIINISGCKENNTDILYDSSYVNEIKAVRKEISFYKARNFVPGLNVAIAQEGKIIYSEGFGLASEDLNVPATRFTKFRIGEVSEIFTALLYHILVENGTLHPDSTVQSYFPEFPEKRFSLPIKHLVQHTSGIREPNREEDNRSGLNIPLKKGIEDFKDDTLLLAPGTLQIPSMFNYNLLGAVMEEVTRLQFHTILEIYVTDSLGLLNTTMDNPYLVIKDRSDFFEHNFIAQVVHATFRDLRYRAPSEGLLSNSEDLVKLGNAFLYSDYISENIKAAVFEPGTMDNNVPLPISNGWVQIEDPSGRRFYGSSGSVNGGSAALLVYPEEELVIACASNLNFLNEELPVFLLAGHFISDNDLGQQNQGQE